MRDPIPIHLVEDSVAINMAKVNHARLSQLMHKFEKSFKQEILYWQKFAKDNNLKID